MARRMTDIALAPPSRRRPFLHGLLAVLPLQVATIPFGLIFGVLAREAGLDFAQLMGMAAAVMAGASTVVALQLLGEQAPALLIVVSSAVVNLRMAMYSAALVPHWKGAGPFARGFAGYALTDQVFAVSIAAYEKGETPTLPEKIAYFFGTAAGCLPAWIFGCVAGYVAGAAIPESWGITMAMPLIFLAMSAAMVRTPAHLIAMTAASLAGLALAGMPNGTGLIPATFIGIAAGMLARRGGVR